MSSLSLHNKDFTSTSTLIDDSLICHCLRAYLNPESETNLYRGRPPSFQIKYELRASLCKV